MHLTRIKSWTPLLPQHHASSVIADTFPFHRGFLFFFFARSFANKKGDKMAVIPHS
jgi:hypothetical protein